MHNIKLTLEYDGSRYQGWQRGKGESQNTISNKIINTIKEMTGEEVELNCGSRTEVGVHAYEQTVNFKTTSPLRPLDMKQYLNRYLPMDIAVITCEEVPERFHASLNAASRTYIYRVAVGDVPSVFERKYTYYSFKNPDINAMEQASLSLIGKHDFKNFSTVKKNKSTEKEIYNIDFYAGADEIQITLTASDFLHNMARLIIGTLLEIGIGKRKSECIENILKGTEKPSAPCDPKGLFLQMITYKEM